MGHRMHRRPSWNYCMYRLISLAHVISGSIVLTVLYALYLCLSLIYCSSNVERFHFFMAANIDFVWSKFAAGLRSGFDMLSTCLRHTHASLRPGLQLARIMECSLYFANCMLQLKRSIKENWPWYPCLCTTTHLLTGHLLDKLLHSNVDLKKCAINKLKYATEDCLKGNSELFHFTGSETLQGCYKLCDDKGSDYIKKYMYAQLLICLFSV